MPTLGLWVLLPGPINFCWLGCCHLACVRTSGLVPLFVNACEPFLWVLNEQASKENYLKAGKDEMVSDAKIASYRPSVHLRKGWARFRVHRTQQAYSLKNFISFVKHKGCFSFLCIYQLC